MTEKRDTFTVPQGWDAERDKDGRATGYLIRRSDGARRHHSEAMTEKDHTGGEDVLSSTMEQIALYEATREIEALKAALTTLASDNARMREALEKIKDRSKWPDGPGHLMAPEKVLNWIEGCARAALSSPPQERERVMPSQGGCIHCPSLKEQLESAKGWEKRWHDRAIKAEAELEAAKRFGGGFFADEVHEDTRAWYRRRVLEQSMPVSLGQRFQCPICDRAVTSAEIVGCEVSACPETHDGMRPAPPHGYEVLGDLCRLHSVLVEITSDLHLLMLEMPRPPDGFKRVQQMRDTAQLAVDMTKHYVAMRDAAVSSQIMPVARAAHEREEAMTPEQIKHMVDRFLSWKLPQSVSSDLCVTDRTYEYPRHGTNLLTADEARQMIEHLFSVPSLAMPEPPHPIPPSPPQEPARFHIGQKVEKYTGDYIAPGEVRSVFRTKAGKVRFVVEHTWPGSTGGFLHIYSESNLRPLPEPGKEAP